MSDYLIRCVDKDAYLRVFIADTTESVEEMRKIHGSSSASSAAMGRLLTASFMMGRMMKNEKDSLTLKVNGGGPIGLVIAVANNSGESKIFAANPQADSESYPNGKLNVKGVVGDNGNITAILDLGLKEPYIGVSPIVSGEIAEDIAYYYATSEQTPTVVALGVLVDTDLSIISSGGYIIQLMPGASEEIISKIENTVKNADSISKMLSDGKKPEDIAKIILKDFEFEIIEKTDLTYKCNCSGEKVKRTIKSLGETEIKSMIEEDNGCEVVCHFCNTKYNFSAEELDKLI